MMQISKIRQFIIYQWVIGATQNGTPLPILSLKYHINKIEGDCAKYFAKGDIDIDVNYTDFKQLIATRDAQIAKIVNVKIEDLKIPLPKCLQF